MLNAARLLLNIINLKVVRLLVIRYHFKKNDKTFQSKKHVSTATSVIFS